MYSIYAVQISYRSHTRVTRHTRVFLLADDRESAMLAAVAYFRGEHPEFNSHSVKPVRAWIDNSERPPFPKIVPVKEVLWAWDADAPHAGANRHKKGKWVPFGEREKARARRAKKASLQTRQGDQKS